MARRCQRRFRFSLRALLALVTLFALWGGYHTNRGWKERGAADVLRKANAQLQHDLGVHGRGPATIADFYRVLVHLLWREQFVGGVHMEGLLTPEIIAAISELPKLKRLSLESRVLNRNEKSQALQGVFEKKVAPETGIVPRALRGQSALDSLTLCGWILSDADCRAIAGCKNIEALQIFCCEMSEEGLAELMTLPWLRSFHLSGCSVTGSA